MEAQTLFVVVSTVLTAIFFLSYDYVFPRYDLAYII